MKLFLLLFVFYFGAQAGEKHRPMDEMHGNCGQFKTDLSKELKLWKNPASSADQLTLERKAQLTLSKVEQVHFTVKPEKTYSGQGPLFAGVFQFKVPATGLYRISAGAKAWYDVVDSSAKKIIPADEFEMQTSCDQIFKTVLFHLDAEKSYQLQVNGSQGEKILFLLSKK